MQMVTKSAGNNIGGYTAHDLLLRRRSYRHERFLRALGVNAREAF
jgi:hypothetical protein